VHGSIGSPSKRTEILAVFQVPLAQCKWLQYYGNRRQSRYRPQKDKIFYEDLLVAALLLQ
jgi:hypothetical protein